MQALAVLACEDGGYTIHRNGNLVGNAAKACGKLDPVVIQGEISRRPGADIQHDLAVLDETRRDMGTAVHCDRAR